MERCWVVHPPEPKASTRSLTVAVGHESTEHANSENADCIELGVRAPGCDQRKQQPKPGAVAHGPHASHKKRRGVAGRKVRGNHREQSLTVNFG